MPPWETPPSCPNPQLASSFASTSRGGVDRGLSALVNSMWINETIRYREKIQKRNEQILADLERGASQADLARKYRVSPTLILQIPKKFEAEKKRKELWGNLSTHVIGLLKKRFGFDFLQNLLDSPMTEHE